MIKPNIKKESSSYKVGQRAAVSAAATTAPQQRTKGHILYIKYIINLKIVVLIKGNAQKQFKKIYIVWCII